MASIVRPSSFPDLPALPPSGTWGRNVLKAHTVLSTKFNLAARLLREGDYDPLRLRLLSEKIYFSILPIMAALEEHLDGAHWINHSTEIMMMIIVELEEAAYSAEGV